MGFSSRMRVVAPVLLAFAMAGASAISLEGQTAKVMLAEPPAPLLPESLRGGPDHEAGNGAPSWSGVDGPVLIEDGLRRYERGGPQSPVAGGGARGGTITVYQFVDATGAAAAYDYLYKSAPYVVRSGVSVVVANLKGSSASAEAQLRTVETGLPKVGGPKGMSPLLPTYLPTKGLENGSQRYALGPVGYKAMGGVLPPEIVGFDKAAEVVTAKYEGKGTLTMLLYPTPQIAGDHGRQIETEMNREGGAAGTVMLRREGPLVLLTTGAWNAEEAKRLVDGIHLRSEVTWNKPVPPEFHAEIKKTVSLLTSILVFCGLGALAAVILALFLGGGRAAIRVLQGKPAATEPEFLRIDLSGSAARIQTGDPKSTTRG
ncbi:DUF6599 family protein [Tunturiibacter gelidoferens]|uniref:Uncharacterized protein n=1 Tax=Tunturiibacter gelidiferens TaxID=3069689 RepID=A0A9X0QAG5_9BACT|nr:DUF6599 family protein [Edaphobacter lichenicola]MBB5326777.1 hypothetical protein [Edaphobacter lichenicola]